MVDGLSSTGSQVTAKSKAGSEMGLVCQAKEGTLERRLLPLNEEPWRRTPPSAQEFLSPKRLDNLRCTNLPANATVSLSHLSICKHNTDNHSRWVSKSFSTHVFLPPSSIHRRFPSSIWPARNRIFDRIVCNSEYSPIWLRLFRLQMFRHN